MAYPRRTHEAIKADRVAMQDDDSKDDEWCRRDVELLHEEELVEIRGKIEGSQSKTWCQISELYWEAFDEDGLPHAFATPRTVEEVDQLSQNEVCLDKLSLEGMNVGLLRCLALCGVGIVLDGRVKIRCSSRSWDGEDLDTGESVIDDIEDCEDSRDLYTNDLLVKWLRDKYPRWETLPQEGSDYGGGANDTWRTWYFTVPATAFVLMPEDVRQRLLNKIDTWKATQVIPLAEVVVRPSEPLPSTDADEPPHKRQRLTSLAHTNTPRAQE